MILELAGIVHVIAWITFFMGLSNGDQRHTKFIIFKYSLSIKFPQDAESVTGSSAYLSQTVSGPSFIIFAVVIQKCKSERCSWIGNYDLRQKEVICGKPNDPVFALMLTLKIGAE